jgi:hypothetical protein
MASWFYDFRTNQKFTLWLHFREHEVRKETSAVVAAKLKHFLREESN